MPCYSQDAYDGSGNSNIYMATANGISNVTSESMVDGWLSEQHSVGGELGHRRWILDPFLRSTAFGRVDIYEPNKYIIGASMYISDWVATTQANVEFIAFPFNDYPSSALTDNISNLNQIYLSFTVLANKNKHNQWNGDNASVNFKDAIISVTDDGGTNYSINSRSADSITFGVPNCLEWRLNNFQPNIKYNVKISNVKLKDGSVKEYSYWFKVNPTTYFMMENLPKVSISLN
jgi:hypothetical protein